MKVRKAVILAVNLMEQRIKQLAFDANLYEQAGVDYPFNIRAYRERRELREAVTILRSINLERSDDGQERD